VRVPETAQYGADAAKGIQIANLRAARVSTRETRQRHKDSTSFWKMSTDTRILRATFRLPQTLKVSGEV
jgi:hypothetical protein